MCHRRAERQMAQEMTVMIVLPDGRVETLIRRLRRRMGGQDSRRPVVREARVGFQRHLELEGDEAHKDNADDEHSQRGTGRRGKHDGQYMFGDYVPVNL